jgi:hypothetical protein
MPDPIIPEGTRRTGFMTIAEVAELEALRDPPSLRARADTFVRAARFVPPPAAVAENFIAPYQSGLFDLPPRSGLNVKGLWIDLAVQNYDYHKNIAVNVRLHREDGAVEDFLVRPRYKYALRDRRECWGAELPVFFDSGPHGKVTKVSMDYALQIDVDSDGKRDLVRSQFAYDLGDGSSRARVLGNNPRRRDAIDLSRLDEAVRELAASKPPLEVYFTPRRGARDAVIREIDAVIAAKRADPEGRHYIHASVYNINSGPIVDKLIEAHRAGVELELYTSGPQMMPDRPWEHHYRRLQSAGIEVVGVLRDGIDSNHTKIVNFDGKVACAGSFNWEDHAEENNFENMVLIRSPAAALVYESIIQAVGGAEPRRTTVEGPAALEIHYSQAEDGLAEIIDRIDAARESIVLCQFQVRDCRDERGRSLLEAIERARANGVPVTLITDHRIADGGEYHGIPQPNDPTDERLERAGVHVVTVLSPHGEYGSMHDKFAVFDRKTTITGAYNFWGVSESSDDDFMIIEDPVVAQIFLGEAQNLRSRFDPAFDRAEAPKTRLDFFVNMPATVHGEEVFVVGNVPELGDWDVSKGVQLSGNTFPEWRGSVEIPSGVDFFYKYVVRGRDGNVRWEHGQDRRRTADAVAIEESVLEAFRR